MQVSYMLDGDTEVMCSQRGHFILSNYGATPKFEICFCQCSPIVVHEYVFRCSACPWLLGSVV